MFDLFLPFDTMILTAINAFTINTSYVFNVPMHIITILGDFLSIFTFIGIGLFLFKNTRRAGSTILAGIFFVLVCELILKYGFHRLRPFETNSLFREYWILAGRVIDDGFSFPSGHTAKITAAMFIFLAYAKKNKKIIVSILTFLFIVIMAFSRMYLMHHFFTDCIAGFVLGFILSIISVKLVDFIYNMIEKNQNIKFFEFVVNFDLKEFMKN